MECLKSVLKFSLQSRRYVSELLAANATASGRYGGLLGDAASGNMKDLKEKFSIEHKTLQWGNLSRSYHKPLLLGSQKDCPRGDTPWINVKLYTRRDGSVQQMRQPKRERNQMRIKPLWTLLLHQKLFMYKYVQHAILCWRCGIIASYKNKTKIMSTFGGFTHPQCHEWHPITNLHIGHFGVY